MRKLNQDEKNIVVILTNVLKTRRNGNVQREFQETSIGLFSQRMRKLNQDEKNIVVILTNVLKTRRNGNVQREFQETSIGLFSQRMRKLNQDEKNVVVILTNVLKTRRNEKLSQEMICKVENQCETTRNWQSKISKLKSHNIVVRSVENLVMTCIRVS